MNRVILVGRITKDPELKRTNSDISYVQFTIAVNRSYQNKNGEKQADFISCVAWRQTAELIARYIHKGNQIGLEGQIQTRQYDDPNGITRYVTEVMCEQVHFLEPKRQEEMQPYNDVPYQARQPQKPYQPNPSPKQESPFDTSNSTFDITGDDLPF
ncbi:MAG: single-stranded DNA-binding protein [Bacilli bacterium]|nr:single-stranded DNA-binding protein [Bacilli bacterium]